MRLIKTSLRLAEEILEIILASSENQIERVKIAKVAAKTESYLKPAINLLVQLNIVIENGSRLILEDQNQVGQYLSPQSIIKSALASFEPFHVFSLHRRSGKTETSSLKRVRAAFEITNEMIEIKVIFAQYTNYLTEAITPISNVETSRKRNSFGAYHRDMATGLFVNPVRIEGLKKTADTRFDTTRLVRVCNELNDAYQSGNYITVGVLVRVILDHIPPIFNKKNFTEIANNGPKSFKDVMLNLENFHRKIADGFLHSQIRKQEYLPTETTIDCRSAIDVLLAEVINQLN